MLSGGGGSFAVHTLPGGADVNLLRVLETTQASLAGASTGPEPVSAA